jgi:LacI family transcriptional regulator
MPRVTIEAVAAAAGVSAATVSRVLNGHGGMSGATRARVESVLRLHDYRPLKKATAPIGLIDVVFPDLDCSWETQTIRGIEEIAHDAGVGVVVSVGELRPMLHARPSDGMILVTLDKHGTEGVPVVVLDPTERTAGDVPSVGATNFVGARSATEHLLGLGHRRIGMITGIRTLHCSRDRVDGYRAALEDAGQPIDTSLIVRGDFGFEAGHLGGGRLLDSEDPPTAILASCDTMAFGVLTAARQRGLAVPDELSVVGFDDVPEAARSWPPLTTVRQPLLDMGRLAALTILRLIRGEPVDSPRMDLVTELIVRGSTAPPKNR